MRSYMRLIAIAAVLPVAMMFALPVQAEPDTAPVDRPAAGSGDERIVFIDPETGKPRAPTAEEAAVLQSQQKRTTAPQQVEVITRPDGSQMVRMPPRQRSVLQLRQNSDGSREVVHGDGHE